MAAPIHRDMVRCVVPTCRRWWSVPQHPTGVPDSLCACGGDLEVVDMKMHGETLPYIPHEPPPKKNP